MDWLSISENQTFYRNASSDNETVTEWVLYKFGLMQIGEFEIIDRRCAYSNLRNIWQKYKAIFTFCIF